MYGKYVDGKMEFNPEEIKNGKLFNFLKVLMDMKCEIRMWTDDYCYIVEYLERFRKEDGEEFIVNEEVQCEEEEEEISSEQKPVNIQKVPNDPTSNKLFNGLDQTTRDVLESVGNNEID